MGFVHYLEVAVAAHRRALTAWAISSSRSSSCIELMGVLVSNVVLAVRLFANMFAGHMVLATILIFIYVAGQRRHRRACGARSRSRACWAWWP